MFKKYKYRLLAILVALNTLNMMAGAYEKYILEHLEIEVNGDKAYINYRGQVNEYNIAMEEDLTIAVSEDTAYVTRLGTTKEYDYDIIQPKGQ